jgi:regulator of RNase E activity RraA
MLGYASTALFRSAAPPRSGSAYAGLDEQVQSFAELPGPAVVVFQDADSPPAAATFGEVMCSTYKAFGAAGLITSGAGRDLDQVEAIAFPCFTAGTLCAHGYCHFPTLHVPVHVGGLTVHPGDLLHGDRNGVTRVPLEFASEVAHACAEYVSAEAVVLDYLRAGKVDLKGYSAARLACRDGIEALGKRLRGSGARVFA